MTAAQNIDKCNDKEMCDENLNKFLLGINIIC